LGVTFRIGNRTYPVVVDAHGNLVEDLINAPSHYRQGGIAVHAILDAYGLDKKHYLASATEYILRSGFKGSEESDLRKAIWHLNHYIEQHFGGDE
jgi:hypothetical protein